jgi:hypothetical protein
MNKQQKLNNNMNNKKNKISKPTPPKKGEKETM